MTATPHDRASLVERLATLSTAQRRRLVEALADHRIREDPRGALLTAWVTPAGARSPSVDDLRSFLEDRLPRAMVPGRFVVVDGLPRTAAGKVDRTAARTLDAPPAASAKGSDPTGPGPVGPRTDTERVLAGVWADVLGMDVETLGVHDDFFEIGGDSLLSIRVISRAARAGVALRPETFFDAPTIAALAASVTPAGDGEPDPDPTEGSAPLTPIQCWFFERITAGRDRWNQSRLVTLPDGLETDRIETAVGELVRRHGALRLSFGRDDEGRRFQTVAPPSDSAAGGRVRSVALPADTEIARATMIREADREHADLDLEAGRLFRAVVFERPGERRLLLVAHHTLVDAVSWEILVDDLEALLSGAEPPAATASVLAWSRALESAARSEAARGWAGAWLDRPVDASWVDLPVDGPATDAGTHATARVHRLSLAAGPLDPDGSGVDARDRLLGAVAFALHRWTGRRDLQFDLEGLGRTGIPGGPDVSRTVGWFTTVFPVPVSLTDASPEGARRAVAEARTRLPLDGAAWGLARHLHPDPELRNRLAALPRSKVLVNYLGRAAPEADDDAPVRPVDGPGGHPRAADAPRAYLLEINAWRTSDRLEVALEYSADVHRPETIEAVASHLRTALEPRAGHRDPGGPKVDLAGLDQAGLDRVSRVLDELDDPEGR